ncbi:MAG: helix-turn-helix transcriptional regulator [Candidatus Heimdallarchaeota archaeon]|nr:MAG: helix-turn-helix transcriptional regulator [Candidatus Heimdallarchaeota archaeon]
MSYLTSVGQSGAITKIKISPSAKAIFDLLKSMEGTPLAVKDIVRELPYSERTIQYGLRQLQRHNLIEKRSNLRDLRESLYQLGVQALFFRFIT